MHIPRVGEDSGADRIAVCDECGNKLDLEMYDDICEECMKLFCAECYMLHTHEGDTNA
jgi:hypothetical protein